MSFALTVALSVLITAADLVSAWLYVGDPDHLGIDLIRYGREGLILVLALWGMRRAHHVVPPTVLGLLYLAFIAAYALLVGPERLDFGLVVASAGKLALPILLLLVGYGSVNTPARLVGYTGLLALLALASTLFGAWDIRHTEFWTETLEYGHYLNGAKGIVTGFDGYYVLPFNFFGFDNVRRAGGLVAAPLAQGSLVAVGAMAGYAALHRRSLVLALVVLLAGLAGVWQSGTRGAMLVLVIALPLFLMLAGHGRTLVRNLAVLALVVVGSYQALGFVYRYSVNFDDGSTLSHLEALQENLADLDQVALTGPGLGTSGPVAAAAGEDDIGGGEGAIFSIAFQLGLPAALVFTILYAELMRRALAARRHPGAAGDIALASFALGLGIVTTFVTSDHLFSLSGLGVYWILLGGVTAMAANRDKESG